MKQSADGTGFHRMTVGWTEDHVRDGRVVHGWTD